MTLYSEKTIKDQFSKSILAKYRYYKRKKYGNRTAFSKAMEAELRANNRKRAALATKKADKMLKEMKLAYKRKYPSATFRGKYLYHKGQKMRIFK